VLVDRAREGDVDAREQVVERFMPLIASVARPYRTCAGVERRELMQEGVVGLLRALERYDRELGTPFWTYASWWVRQAMQRHVSEMTRAVVLSDRALRHLARVRHARRELGQQLGHEAGTGEIADATGLTRDQVESLLAVERPPRALDGPASRESSAGSLVELVADPAAQDAYEEMPDRLFTSRLPSLLDTLDARERTVVRKRYGLDGERQTLRELAGVLGVSAERVRQIESSSLVKLHCAAHWQPSSAA
jgi:RNA polymerase sigma factor (sigma-70 family)